MKNLGPLLAGGLTLLIVLLIGVFSFLPIGQVESEAAPNAAAAGPIVVPAADTSQLEATMAEREAVYQIQIQQLSQTLQERQNSYQSQIQTLTDEISTAQTQLPDLRSQEESLSLQITQLETSRAERLATYQAQLEQASNQYADRLAQLQGQLTEAQTKLAEVNVQLGQ